jgi:NAD(P)-dependent dehydrogenase (short-subunit alcohol dehydrogenase family)
MPTHLLTGAGSGIGAAVARRLHDRGDRLVLVSRSDERAAELEESFPGSRHLVADLARPELVEAVGEELPERLDSVVHAAGVVGLGPVAELSAASWADQVTVNLLAPAALSRLALPALRAARGTVVFVNSGAGLSANPDWSAYAASKFGLRALADALRAEEQERGVRVSTVYPGRTATPMQVEVHRQEGREYDAARWSDAETVAATILHVLDLPGDSTIPDVTVRPAPR